MKRPSKHRQTLRLLGSMSILIAHVKSHEETKIYSEMMGDRIKGIIQSIKKQADLVLEHEASNTVVDMRMDRFGKMVDEYILDRSRYATALSGAACASGKHQKVYIEDYREDLSTEYILFLGFLPAAKVIVSDALKYNGHITELTKNALGTLLSKLNEYLIFVKTELV